MVFGALQTFKYPAPTVLRRSIDITVTDETGKSLIYGTRIIRNVDTSAGNYKNDLTTADRFGWICLSTMSQSAISEDVNGDGIVDIPVTPDNEDGKYPDSPNNPDGLGGATNGIPDLTSPGIELGTSVDLEWEEGLILNPEI